MWRHYDNQIRVGIFKRRLYYKQLFGQLWSDEFMDAVMEHGAKILGMSALLTTTMPNMGKTIDAFEEAGMRDVVKIMVGGAPLSQEFADDMGADGYGKDAISCVDLAKQFAGTEESEVETVATPSD